MHIPVLLQEVIEVLDPKPGAFFIDGTLGAGGHATELLRRLEPGGSFWGLDWDASAVERLRSDLQREFSNMKKVFLASGNYAEIKTRLSEQQLPRANGLLLDLGFSSNQLSPDGGSPEGREGSAMAGRGFSFLKDEPLRMTYNAQAVPVSSILQTISKEELRRVLFEFGEERHAAAIAAAIITARDQHPIETSGELSRIVEGIFSKRGRLHPATKTFQALRIFANAELENLKTILADLPEIMAPARGGQAGGRVAIISFHSLEDRLVKQAFSALQKSGAAMLLTKKPITASDAEIKSNPRSRSAKLRAIQFS